MIATRRPAFQRLYGGARTFARERVGTYRSMFITRLVRWPLNSAVARVSGRLRRDCDLIAFGSVSNRFADNAAYLFVRLHAHPEMRCVWLTGSATLAARLRAAGFDARTRWSISGMRAAARASWYVYSFAPSDVHRWFVNGAHTLNVWHGVGLKRVQRDRGAPFDRIYAAADGSLTGRVFAEDRRSPDWMLSTSRPLTLAFARAFGIENERCLELGYPRNEHLLEGGAPPSILVDPAIVARLAAAEFVVGYFPTWRYDSRDALPAGAPDLAELGAILERQGATLLFKPHHASATISAHSPAICVLAPDADLNAYLGHCDVLITDYSSVANDFLLLDRPIIAFMPDLEEDLAKDRFTEDPLQMTPGVVARTVADLYDLLGDARAVPRAANFARLREHFWGSSGTAASARIADFLLGSVRPPPTTDAPTAGTPVHASA